MAVSQALHVLVGEIRSQKLYSPTTEFNQLVINTKWKVQHRYQKFSNTS